MHPIQLGTALLVINKPKHVADPTPHKVQFLGPTS